MPISGYQADVSVAIAFDSGFSTPAASRTWTDVSDYVELAEGIDIQWGRQDERSTADANQLSLTLDNSDGRFTAGKTTSPYYPNVKLDRPIRVTVDPVDGSAFVAFLGYINEWPVEWNGTDSYAKAAITASSRLARLGMVRSLRSIVETEILADSPVAYYPLGEPAGATQANDVSGNKADPLVMAGDGTDVVFGNATGPGTDDLTAAEFAGGKWLGNGPSIASGAAWSVECFFSTAQTNTALLHFGVHGTNGGSFLFLNTSGELNALIQSSTDSDQITGGAAPAANDGATHHAALTVSAAGDVDIYLDGAAVGSGTISGGPPIVGLAAGYAVATLSPVRDPSILTGTLAHVVLYDYVLDPARIAAHANAGVDGFAGETTDERLERYAALGAIPAAEVSAEAGSTTMAHVDTSGQQVVELLRTAEQTEGGVLFDARDGTLTMHNRAHRYTASSLFTLNMQEHEVEAGYSPRLDRSKLLNDVTGSNVGGTTTARVTDEGSIEDYGYASGSVETASEDDDEPRNLASWQVYTYATPKARVPSLSVDALAQVDKTPSSAAVLAATVGDKITVTNHPTQAAATSADYFIEGGSLSIGPESLTVSWNVSPSSPWDQVLVVGDATRGVVGTNPVAF